MDYIFIIVGLIGLFFGGEALVRGSVGIAKRLGMSSLLIGLTIVAVGTSLPELATSVIAAFRKQSEIAIGNIVGSNIFNVLGILGVTALISPIPVEARFLTFDLPVTIALSVDRQRVALRQSKVSHGLVDQHPPGGSKPFS